MSLSARAAASPSALLAQLADARRATDALLARVRPAHLLERPIAQRHRFIFYLGHLDAFDWNLLAPRCGGERSHPFDERFATGIDPLGDVRPQDAAGDWPDVRQIDAYVALTRGTLDALLPVALAGAAGDSDEAPLAFVLAAAIEHRLMHAETLAYMLNRCALGRQVGRAGTPARAAPPPSWVSIPAGTVTLGRRRDDWQSFGWDNEFEAQDVAVEAFEIQRCMVANGDFLRFVEAGGYEEAALWPAQAWAWRRQQNLAHPPFWERHRGCWYQRTLRELVPLPLDWPVYVSHAEASAYAHWAGLALPSEAQWQRAAYATPGGRMRAYPWGSVAPEERHGNFGLRHEEPQAVDAHPAGASAFGVLGLLGNGWEWTSTPFAPLPGFVPFAFYPGYSADFFDGQHYVLKGGGLFTATALLRRSFRNWFQPFYEHVHAGFRCVRTA
jgi:ergothioneine biosynthesis protein EgtB